MGHQLVSIKNCVMCGKTPTSGVRNKALGVEEKRRGVFFLFQAS